MTKKTNRFVLSDESVNRYGFRVLTSGIDLTAFLANPVMFYVHDRTELPIGIWKDIRVEGTLLTAEPEFDEDDEFAMRIKSKVDKGILKMTSVGLDVLGISESPELMLPGQTRPTVTKSEMSEASIADIGANKNALKLNFSDLTVTSEKDLNTVLPLIKPLDNTMSKQVALKLGLPETATQAEIDAKIESLQLAAKPASESTDKVIPVVGAGNAKLVDSVIKLGKARGFVNDDNQENYRKLAAADADSLLDVFSAGTAPVTAPKADTAARVGEVLTAQLRSGVPDVAKPGDEKASWSLTDYEQKDPNALRVMLSVDPEKYKKLFHSLHGVTPSDADLRAIA